jgi:hypothetical protein
MSGQRLEELARAVQGDLWRVRCVAHEPIILAYGVALLSACDGNIGIRCVAVARTNPVDARRNIGNEKNSTEFDAARDRDRM